MEHAQGIELRELIDRHHHCIFENKTSIIISIIYQLIQVVSHLHAAKVCHKDIKPENIIVQL